MRVTFSALLAMSFLLQFASAQDLRFSIPVEGVLGRDFVVVNHVDHDTAVGRFQDHTCGVQTYDGHDGTDFVIRSFRQMDSGVYVLAAAAGRVIAVLDTLYDRNKVLVQGRGFGNYIAVQHDEGYITYYAHIRTNSAIVAIGDVVKRNQRIAFVGSSGYSSDPHLHFEAWRRVDPFAGACGDDLSLWQTQPDYNTSYRLLDHGLTTWPPLLDTIRERPPKATLVKRTDSVITFWSVQQGTVATDEFAAEWYAPDGTLWYRFASTPGFTAQFMYWWMYINRPSTPGTYICKYLVNGVERSLDSVDVEPTTGIQPIGDGQGAGKGSAAINLRIRGSRLELLPSAEGAAKNHVQLYNIAGQLIASYSDVTSLELPSGVVLVRVRVGDREMTVVH